MSIEREPYVLAVDLGTSGPKVGVVDGAGEVLAWAFQPVKRYMLPNGGCEQDPEEWWTAIVRAARDVLGREGIPRHKIAALCCTAQWNGTVAVDRQGKALGRAIIWLDSRGAADVARQIGGFPEVEGYSLFKILPWVRLTGGAPTKGGKDPVGHILYLRRAHPEIYRQTYMFLEPKDYLNLRLTGEFATSADCIAMHWVTDNRDLEKVHYVPRLCRLSGLEQDKLPPIRRAVDVLGTLSAQAAQELGLPQSTRVVMGTPDVHAAALGSGALADFRAHVYLGTSAWISCHVPYKKTDLTHNIASLPSAIPGRYLLVNEQDWAAGCLDFLLENLLCYPRGVLESPAPADAHIRLNAVAAEAPPGSDGVIFAPWLYGERSPVENSTVRGGFFNLSPAHTQAHLARAVFEGVAFNARWLFTYVEKFAARRLDDLHFIGGGAVSDLWCQIFADVLDRNVVQIEQPRLAPLRGAAFLALVGIGAATFHELEGAVRPRRVYAPRVENKRVYEPLYQAFLKLYQRNMPVYRHLRRYEQEMHE